MIRSYEAEWRCRKHWIIILYVFILSKILISVVVGYLLGCNLVISLLCFFWVLGSFLSLFNGWNKEIILDCLVCLDWYGFQWRVWFDLVRIMSDSKVLFLVPSWIGWREWVIWFGSQVWYWSSMVMNGTVVEMFTLVSSNQVHPKVWKIAKGKSYTVRYTRQSYYISHWIMRNISWFLAFVTNVLRRILRILRKLFTEISQIVWLSQDVGRGLHNYYIVGYLLSKRDRGVLKMPITIEHNNVFVHKSLDYWQWCGLWDWDWAQNGLLDHDMDNIQKDMCISTTRCSFNGEIRTEGYYGPHYAYVLMDKNQFFYESTKLEL